MSDGDTKPEWDGKALTDGIGMGCFSVLCQFRVFFACSRLQIYAFIEEDLRKGNEVRSEGALSRRGLKQIKLAYNPCRPGGPAQINSQRPSCQTASKRRTDGRTNERTDAGNRIWCILVLKCDIR